MHILVISPTPTSPADQGNRRRVRNVCKALQARGAKIHFGYFPREWTGKFSMAEHTEMTKDWDFFDTIVPSKPFVHSTRDQHFGIDDWWDEAIGRFIAYKCGGVAFDACLVNYTFLSKAFEYLPRNVVRLLDTHDRLSGRREMLERNGVAPEFFYTSDAQEKIALDRADLVLAINPEEATFFRSITPKPVITLGHITPKQDAAKALNTTRAAQRMGFLGSSNSVNVKNINDFFIALAKEAPTGIPGIEFHFYGSCCPRLVIPREIEAHIKLHGRIDDVDEFYRDVDCVVVPFLFGTGQKIKLIEALSFGKPLIATANASEGSHSTAEMHQLNSFRQVIDAVRRFGSDGAFRDRLAEESTREFAKYEKTTEAAIDAVFNITNVNSNQVLIDRASVAKSFAGKSRAETLNDAARVISVLNTLDLTGALSGKALAVQSLVDGIADAQSDRITTDIIHQSQIELSGGAQVLLGDLCESMPTAASKVQLRVHLPNCDVASRLHTGTSVDIYFDCLPKAEAASSILRMAEIVQTPVYAQAPNSFSAFEQLIVLARDLASHDLPQLLAEIANGVKLRAGRSLMIWCIDNAGDCGKWNGASLDRDTQGRGLLETIDNARAIVMAKPSITLSLGVPHMATTPFHRMLIAESGPFISLLSGRATPMDGELVARSAHEAASWIANCVMAPNWANTVSAKLFAGVSAVASGDVAAGRLRFSISGIKSKFIAEQIAELAASGAGQ